MGIKNIVGELTGIKKFSDNNSTQNNINYGNNSNFYGAQNQLNGVPQNPGNINADNNFYINKQNYNNIYPNMTGNQFSNIPNNFSNVPNIENNYNEVLNNSINNHVNNPQNNRFSYEAVNDYQQELLRQKNNIPNNENYNIMNQPQNFNSANNYQHEVFNHKNSFNNKGNFSDNSNHLIQNNFNYDNPEIYNQNYYDQYNAQNMIMPRQNNFNNNFNNIESNNYYHQSRRQQRIAPLQFENGRFSQNFIDFDAPKPIDYGNYQEMQELERMSDFNYLQQRSQRIGNQYDNPSMNYNMQSVNNPINYNQYNYENYNNVNNNQSLGRNEFYNELPAAKAFYNPSDEYQISNSLPNQIAKEVRSEKLRVSFLMLFGIAGVIATSIMIAGYYYLSGLSEEIRTTATFAGLKFEAMFRPFFSITLLLISILIFSLGATDYSLLISNIKKYERDLALGNEKIPYFITRNYHHLISRGVYVTWISFTTYIVGAISLGILYGLENLYDSGDRTMYFLFWKIATLKSFKSEISVNIIILISTLLIHIVNIVWTRARKNNIISYYGQSIFSSEQERQIRKQANKICIILWSVVIAIILFVVIIPWLIIRKRNGKSLVPWGHRNNN